MNILYVPTKDPRLKNGGNEQRTNLLWESLKRYGKVYTFLLDRNLDVSAEFIGGQHPIYKFRPIEQTFSGWRIINSVLSRLSLFSIYGRKTTRLKSPEDVFKGVHFDIVVTRYIHPLCDFKYWDIAPLLIDVDDHPIQVYETVRKKRLPVGLKSIGRLVTRKQANYIIDKSEGGWIANKDQVVLLGDNYVFLPNIPQMPSSSYNFRCTQRKNLFTVGAMGYEPNKDGITRFLKEIWPTFHKKYPNVQYYIVGKGASEADVKFWNSFEEVKYLGFVEELEALYEKTLATVVPVYSGGGTCIKTLESMSFSRVCLSTKFGARGLSEDAIEGTGLLVFDDAISFCEQFEKLQKWEQCRLMETKGLDYVMTHYSKKIFDEAVDKVFTELPFNIQ